MTGWLRAEDLLEEGDTLGGDRFGIGSVVKDFDGDVAVIIRFLQSFDDGRIVDLAGSGPPQIWIVGVKVSSVSFALCNDFWDGLFLITHRFDIKVQTARGVVDAFDQADCFSGSVEEISFCS